MYFPYWNGSFTTVGFCPTRLVAGTGQMSTSEDICISAHPEQKTSPNCSYLRGHVEKNIPEFSVWSRVSKIVQTPSIQSTNLSWALGWCTLKVVPELQFQPATKPLPRILSSAYHSYLLQCFMNKRLSWNDSVCTLKVDTVILQKKLVVTITNLQSTKFKSKPGLLVCNISRKELSEPIGFILYNNALLYLHMIWNVE